MELEHPNPITTDIVDIPVEGMFASADWRVICRNGENYYLPCGQVVLEKPEGGTTHCVKPLYHPSWEHEDFYGITKTREFGTEEMDEKVREAARKAILRTGLEPNEVFNVLNALLYYGFTLSREVK